MLYFGTKTYSYPDHYSRQTKTVKLNKFISRKLQIAFLNSSLHIWCIIFVAIDFSSLFLVKNYKWFIFTFFLSWWKHVLTQLEIAVVETKKHTSCRLGRMTNILSLIERVEAVVSDLEHPASVNDTVAGGERAVDTVRHWVQIAHPLQQAKQTSAVYAYRYLCKCVVDGKRLLYTY